jgi:hypothetical protein
VVVFIDSLNNKEVSMSSSPEPKQELDSPFLNEALFVDEERESTSAWETRLNKFQLESPFLRAFEEGWGAITNENHDEFLDKLGAEEFDELEGEFDDEEELLEFQTNEKPVSVETLKQEIVRLAQEQLKRWKKGALMEAEIEGLVILKEYYQNCGVKVTQQDKLGDKNWHCKNAWSAVFVSWIMKQAGAGERFRYSRSHEYYISAAKKNRNKKDKDKPFWAFSATEIAPEIGDLVCRDRPCGECDDCSGATFENIDKLKKKPKQKRCTHCDIVTEKPDSKNEILVIGGNVGDSVRERVIRIDKDGKVISENDDCKFFAVITLRDRTVDSTSTSKERQEEQPKLESWHDFFNELNDEIYPKVEEWENEEELEKELDEYPFELQIDTTPPRELKLAEHFHVPKSLPDEKVGLTRLEPNNMNPGYINSAVDQLQVDRTANSLQMQLENLIKTKYKKYLGKTRKDDRIRIVLVDLTCAKLFNPDFAGWGETISTYGASVPKICTLYAVHQLCFDLNHFADKNSITKKEDLIKAAKASWEKIGFSSMPRIDELFNFVVPENLSRPVSVIFTPELLGTLTKIFKDDDKCAVDLLISQLGFPYIASVMWQSGLRHPTRGGLWLWGGYCCADKNGIKRLLNLDMKAIKCTGGLSFRWKENPVQQPKPVFLHNATALSVATYFTLLAQGRLVNDQESKKIAITLQDACSFFWDTQLGGLSLDPPPTKCGIFGNLKHDSILIKRIEGGKEICYAAVALTIGALDFPFKDFLKDLDKLIQDKN